MCTITETAVTHIAEHDMHVEKYVEKIGGKTLSSPRGYNYDKHDPEKEGTYHSYPEGSNLGNAIFVIPAGNTYKFDKYQNIIQSDKIMFVKFKNQ